MILSQDSRNNEKRVMMKAYLVQNFVPILELNQMLLQSNVYFVPFPQPTVLGSFCFLLEIITGSCHGLQVILNLQPFVE